ncbi:CU044_2847 family protein [Kibdelosporangium lantanae]|uniref:CU044_2847 family protein n=1 Tax=Kibdelosporangium lantanae TaxID=1497396 RepID=A0ABW3M8K3_9PSEU
MTELVRVPLDNGEVLVVEVDRADLTQDAVVLAAAAPGKAIGQLSHSLESGLRALRPALAAIVAFLKEAAPDTVSVEFGMKLGGETGIIVAKGSVEANFKIKAEWRAAAAPAAVEEPAEEPAPGGS